MQCCHGAKKFQNRQIGSIFVTLEVYVCGIVFSDEPRPDRRRQQLPGEVPQPLVEDAQRGEGGLPVELPVAPPLLVVAVHLLLPAAFPPQQQVGPHGHAHHPRKVAGHHLLGPVQDDVVGAVVLSLHRVGHPVHGVGGPLEKEIEFFVTLERGWVLRIL